MSLSRVIPHPDSGYIEVILDGYADWLSAVQRIELVAEAIEQLNLDRILIDFERVNMQIAVVEAPEVVRLFHVFANRPLSLGIIRSGDGRADATIEAFAAGMGALGHDIEFLEGRAAAAAWVQPRSKRIRRAG